MSVELIRLPGSGKTTVARRLEKKLGKKLVKIERKTERYAQGLLFILSNPTTAFSVLLWTIKLHRGSLYLLRHKIFFLMFRAFAKETFVSKGVIIDEGLLQYLCAISDRPLTEEEVSHMCNNIKLSDRKIVRVFCNESLRLDRMKKRKRVPRSIFGEAYVDAFYACLPGNTDLIFSELSKKNESEVIDTTI